MPSSRKAALGRDGVTEQNWITLMAQEVVESNALFARMRKERLDGTWGTTSSAEKAAAAATAPATTGTPGAATPQVAPGTPRAGTPSFIRGAPGRTATPLPQPVAPAPAQPVSAPMVPVISTEGLSQSALRALRITATKRPGEVPVPRKEKVAKVSLSDQRVKGVYEPHTGLTHYRVDTQPTRSRMERVYDNESYEKSVLGGTLTGSGAWGLAWIDTYADTRDYQREKEEEMKKLFAELTS